MNDPPQPGEVMPILPVSHGGGKCKTGSDGNICGGGERGACVDGEWVDVGNNLAQLMIIYYLGARTIVSIY